MATATEKQETNGQATGHLMTPREELIQELVNELQDQYDAVSKAKKDLVEPRAEVNRLDKILKEEEQSLEEIVEALAHARTGNPIQGRLFKDRKAKASNAIAARSPDCDPGKTASLEVLEAHGLTTKKRELLNAAEINTVGELECRMRTDEWWHKKIKGFGEKNVDALSDALFAWRKLNPVPEENQGEAAANGEVTPQVAPELVVMPDYTITLDDKLKAAASVSICLWKNGEQWVAGGRSIAFPGTPEEVAIFAEYCDAAPWLFARFDTRNEAIVSCCIRMEKAWKDLGTPTGKKVAKRISEVRKLLESEIAAAAEEAASSQGSLDNSKPQPEQVPPESPDVVQIPLANADGIRMSLLSVQGENGIWRGSFTVDDDVTNVHIAPAIANTPTHGTANDCLTFVCAALLRWLRVENPTPRQQAAVADVEKFAATIKPGEAPAVPF